MNKITKKIISVLASASLLLPTTNGFAYTPRTTFNDADCALQYWTYSSSGNVFTRNRALAGGNCTWYAYGRAWELLGSRPTLSLNGAHKWYNYNDGYERGQEPKLGAIACWSDAGSTVGHVAVVEAIDGNNVTCSESGWSYTSGYFKTVTRNRYNMNYTLGGVERKFQGYIYLPIDDSMAVTEGITLAEAPKTIPTDNISDSQISVPNETLSHNNTNISIFINGSYMPFSNESINDNGTTIVPARDLFEALGGSVFWDNNTKVLTAYINNSVFTAKNNSNLLYINDVPVEANRPLSINENGKTMLPLRATLNMLGAEILSIDDNMNINIVC